MWLRSLHAARRREPTRDEVERLLVCAGEVPAWTEPFSRLLGQAVEPVVACPQIIGVEFPAMSLSRAEWLGGNLQLSLAPLVEDPDVFSYFRIVGAEPRNWDVHGLDGATFELTLGGLNVRVPMVRADIELIRGSY